MKDVELIGWSTDQAASRYEAYLKLYKKTKADLLDVTGKKFGLGEEDFDEKITTIEDKLGKSCALFREMDSLFGNRQNVRPAHWADSVDETSDDEDLTDDERNNYVDESQKDVDLEIEESNHRPIEDSQSFEWMEEVEDVQKESPNTPEEFGIHVQDNLQSSTNSESTPSVATSSSSSNSNVARERVIYIYRSDGQYYH